MSDGLIRAGVWLLIAGVVVLIVVENFDSSSSADPPVVPASPVAASPGAGQPGIGGRSQTARDLAADELGYYPPAPSRAVGMTPAWREFAAAIDRACVETYNVAQAREAQVYQVAQLRDWSRAKVEAARDAIWSQQGPQIQLAATKLGSPPEKAGLFERWLANVMTRSALFRRASHAAARGDLRRELEICNRINRLKLASDRLGQRFGLRICTSN